MVEQDTGDGNIQHDKSNKYSEITMNFSSYRHLLCTVFAVDCSKGDRSLSSGPDLEDFVLLFQKRFFCRINHLYIQNLACRGRIYRKILLTGIKKENPQDPDHEKSLDEPQRYTKRRRTEVIAYRESLLCEKILLNDKNSNIWQHRVADSDPTNEKGDRISAGTTTEPFG